MAHLSQVCRRTQALFARALGLSLVLVVLAVPRRAHAVPERPTGRASAGVGRVIKVTLRHDGNGTASVNTNATSATTFTLENIGTGAVSVNLVATACSGSLSPGSCSPSPSSATLDPGDVVSVTVDFAGGTSDGPGTLTLAAKNTSGTTLASSSVAVTVSKPLPTVSAAPHLGDRRDVSQCVADCFESTFAYSTPAYVSLDVPRSVTLLYRSGRAYPHGTLTLDVTDPYATATQFRLKLKDSTGAYVPFANDSTALYFTRNPSGPTRIVAQFPAASIPTSAQLYTAEVTMIWPSGAQGTASSLVRIIVINDRVSPFGAGVDVVGLQRLFTTQSGGVLVTDGSGSASFFAGTCSPTVACDFTSPAGDFSRLSTTGAGYRRAYPDSTVVRFDNVGKQLSTKSRFGDSTWVAWATTVAGVSVPTQFTDPVGQTIVLNYRGVEAPYQTGSFGQFVVQGGARWANFGVLTSGNLEHLVDADGVCCAVAVYDGLHRLTRYDNKVFAPVGYYAYRYGATLDYSEGPSVTLDSNVVARPRVTLRNAADALLTAGAVTGSGSSTAPLAVLSDQRALVIGPRNDTTFLSLNRFGSADTVKAPLTNAASAQYDPLTGNLLRSVSPTGAVMRYTWSANKLTQAFDSTAAKTVNIEYETAYSLPKHISGSVAEQFLTYDKTKAGWPLKTSKVGSLSALDSTTYVTDAFGRPTSITDPGHHTTSYGYQSTGLRNRISVTALNNQTTSYGRDAWGRVVSVTDPYGRQAKTQYDPLNRRTLVADAAMDTTKFQYDALSNLSVVTDPKGQVYSIQRNALGWVTEQTDPGSRVDTTKYDVAGRVVYVRTRAGRKLTFAYDSLNRITKKLGVTSGDSVKYAYDSQSRWVIDSVYSGTTLVTVDSVVTDTVGRTIREFTNRPGVGSWRIFSAFNPADPGRSSAFLTKTSVNPPTGEAQVDFTYDATKRLSTIVAPFGISTFGYDAENFPSTVTFPSGLVETTTQNSGHSESTRSYSISAIDTVLGRWYRTDSLSRIAERGAAGPLFQTFSYDSADRIRTWVKKQRTNTPSCINDNDYGYICNGTIANTLSSVAMSYDRAGNPADVNTVVTTGNRLTSFNGFAMTHDADGNMLTRVGPGGVSDTYTWDDFGQLKSVTRSGVTQPTTFAYDGFGRRIRKTSTAGTIHYIWDGQQIFAEVDGSGTTLQTYTYNPGIDEPRSVTAGGETYFMSTGLGGDVNGLIKRSDNSIAALYTYTPWGELETDQQLVGGVRINSLRWRGLAYDSETGLYQVRARYYDPATRRFISEDPIGIGGGINQYAFAGADPVNRRDPSGLCWVWNGIAMANTPDDVTDTYHWSNDCPLDPAIPGVGGIYDSPWGEVSIARPLIDPTAVANTLKKIARWPENGRTTRAYTFSWIIPMVWGLVGPAVNVSLAPRDRLICLAGGLGVAPGGGHSISLGAVAVHAFEGKTIRDVLSGWSLSGGYNVTPAKGAQGSINSSGWTAGYSYGIPGASASLTSTDSPGAGGCINY